MLVKVYVAGTHGSDFERYVKSLKPGAIQYRSFIITMKDRADRAKAIQKRLAGFGSCATIVEAVDGREIPDDEFAQLANSRGNCPRSKRLITKGELGCWLSHKKTWRMVSDEDWNFAFIFEDDVEISEDLSSLANALSLIEDWDIVNLYRKKSRRPLFRRELEDGLALTTSFSATSGTFAYAITRDAAQRLFDSHPTFAAPIDVELRLRSRNRIKVYDLNKDLVVHDAESKSIIEPDRLLERTEARSRSSISHTFCSLMFFMQNLQDNIRYLARSMTTATRPAAMHRGEISNNHTRNKK